MDPVQEARGNGVFASFVTASLVYGLAIGFTLSVRSAASARSSAQKATEWWDAFLVTSIFLGTMIVRYVPATQQFSMEQVPEENQ